jgi:hypothetical protein
MFVGHYGPSFAINSFQRSIPLWTLFIAVQFLDVVWSVLVFFGVEKVRIVPGITASNPFDLYYMPFTHSLVAAFAWALVGIIVSRVLLNLRNWSAAVWIGVAVFSHWVLDFVVHRRDLPLYDDAAKLGLGLWNYPILALSLEALLLFGGMIMYLRRTKPLNGFGRFGPPIFGILMLAIQSYVFFGPPPTSPVAAGMTALVSYLVFAAGVYWLDRNRQATSETKQSELEQE